MEKIIKTLINIALTSVVLFSFSIVNAQTQDYNVLVPLPGITGPQKIQTYIPAAFKLGIGIAAVLAFVMITFGGIMYATSDAITGKSAGREYAENAVYGLLLVLAAYAILNTINPKLLEFDLDIRRVDVQAGTTSTVEPGTTGIAPCTNCVTLASVNTSIPTKGNNIYATLTLANELSRVADQMGECGCWQVNEGYTSAEGIHVQNSCHDTGICADVVPVNRQDPTAINTLYGTGLSRGGFSSITFEVTAGTDVTKLKAGCSSCKPPVPGLNSNINVKINDQANGWHFHVVQ